ncbi:MAG: RidA family protein [Proteobacteria bacterium]|nr:RidA family protein [Pseudomonadota bacterium]
MSQRINIADGVKWENVFGYSRAVRVGNTIEVSGTTAIAENGEVVGESDPYRQTQFILEKISTALNKAGGSMGDVVRTRLYLTDASFADQVGRAHLECFADIRPASTLVEISALIAPGLLVEIEATAIVSKAD